MAKKVEDKWGTVPTMVIPVPVLAPLDIPVISSEAVQDVWDAFVKPDQDKGNPQSVEMRLLMAILRSVHEGMEKL